MLETKAWYGAIISGLYNHIIYIHTHTHIYIYFINVMFIGSCIIVIAEEWNSNLMSLAILFHFLCAQHVSDINISIFRSLRLCCWITTSVVWTENKTTNVAIQQHSRKLLKMDTLMSETCRAHKKWNKIASDIKLIFHSSSVLYKIYYTWRKFMKLCAFL